MTTPTLTAKIDTTTSTFLPPGMSRLAACCCGDVRPVFSVLALACIFLTSNIFISGVTAACPPLAGRMNIQYDLSHDFVEADNSYSLNSRGISVHGIGSAGSWLGEVPWGVLSGVYTPASPPVYLALKVSHNLTRTHALAHAHAQFVAPVDMTLTYVYVPEHLGSAGTEQTIQVIKSPDGISYEGFITVADKKTIPAASSHVGYRVNVPLLGRRAANRLWWSCASGDQSPFPPPSFFLRLLTIVLTLITL